MPDPTTGDEPIDKALAWVENKLRTLAIRAELLAEVRDELVRTAGKRRPDGWAQAGRRGDE